MPETKTCKERELPSAHDRHTS